MTQDCPARRLKVDPAGTAQVSASVKFGRLVKSVCPVSEADPDGAIQVNVRPVSAAPD